MNRGPLLLILCCVLATQGCVGSGGSKSSLGPCRYVGGDPPLATNIAYVRSSGPHPFSEEIPDYGEIQVRKIDLMSREAPKMFVAPRDDGGLYPLLVWNESIGNLLLAPGYNPVSIDLDRRMTHFVVQEDERFADKYPRYVEWPNRRSLFDREQGVSVIVWVPLPANADDVRNGHVVDHSLLVYILREDSLWRSLKAAAGAGPESRQAVQVACQTILDLMKAHDLEWPEFQWNNTQREIRSWCENMVASQKKSH